MPLNNSAYSYVHWGDVQSQRLRKVNYIFIFEASLSLSLTWLLMMSNYSFETEPRALSWGKVSKSKKVILINMAKVISSFLDLWVKVPNREAEFLFTVKKHKHLRCSPVFNMLNNLPSTFHLNLMNFIFLQHPPSHNIHLTPQSSIALESSLFPGPASLAPPDVSCCRGMCFHSKLTILRLDFLCCEQCFIPTGSAIRLRNL